MKNEINTTQI